MRQLLEIVRIMEEEWGLAMPPMILSVSGKSALSLSLSFVSFVSSARHMSAMSSAGHRKRGSFLTAPSVQGHIRQSPAQGFASNQRLDHDWGDGRWRDALSRTSNADGHHTGCWSVGLGSH